MAGKSNISYVNGRYMPHRYASVGIEDRGLQFSDGIYEVVSWINGRWIDIEWHLDRLEYSLSELRIPMPMARKALEQVCRRLVEKNRIRHACYVYIQINRGEAPRYHNFPNICAPNVILTVKRFAPPSLERALSETFKIHTTPEIRWSRPDIKSVSLLGNVLAKQAATEHRAHEAWFVDDEGYVTEGSSTNAWIVTEKQELITQPPKGAILNGITRRRVLDIAQKNNLSFIERPFSLEEAKQAKEAFFSSSTMLVKPVGMIDDAVIGDGKVGSVTAEIIRAFYAFFHIQ